MKFFSIIFMSLVLFSLNYSAVYSKNSYFNNGKKLFEKKKYKYSKFYFEKDIIFNTVLLLNPKNEEAIYLLTLLNIKNSNFSKAAELINKLNLVCKKMCSSKLELQSKLNSSLKSE